jgi:bacterioferritin-associated ferredoxin
LRGFQQPVDPFPALNAIASQRRNLLTFADPKPQVPPMYVCVCHALTDRDVSAAKADGAASDAEVFRHFGVEPQCGFCAESIKCLLRCREAGGQPLPAHDDAPPCGISN